MGRHRKKTRSDYSPWVGEMLRVQWEDTAKYDEEKLKTVEQDSPMVFYTYGQCVSETERALIVACTIPTNRKDKELRDIVKIPKRVIDKVTIFEEVNQ